ncbi:MAG: acyltransferase family protein, partial [Opitutae bacterium]
MWFLYDLLWLVVGFSLLVSIFPSGFFKNITQYLTESHLRLLWLVPITFVPQNFMPDFGPDTSVELKPNFIKLSYYFIFFAYGAACYGRPGFTEKAGRYWPFYFLAALPVLIIGILLYEKIPQSESTYKPLAALCSATYVWLMILGSVGFFRKFFAAENPRIRYVSDSAYWLYLAHLPLTQALQIWMSEWYVPS